MFFILLWLCSFFVPTFGSPCPPGALYGEATGKCYHFVDEPFPFLQAEEYCVKAAKGHLVSINNVYEMIAVEEFAAKAFPYGVKAHWIGGKLIGNRPQWINGNAFKYSNWRNGLPPNNLPNSCIQVSAADGSWSPATCENLNYFICESPATLFPLFKAKYGCESGWQHFPSTHSCYTVIYNFKWQDAERFCVQHGAHLASIHSEAENNFIYNLPSGEPRDMTEARYIGLYDPTFSTSKKRTLVWTDGSPVDFRKWASKQPDNYGGVESCGHLRMHPSKGGTEWNDLPCKNVRNAVCKKPATLF